MLKTKIIKKTYIIPLLAVMVVGTAITYYAAPGHAQSVQQLEGEISQLENEIQNSKERLGELRQQENTLENRLEIIRTDINKVEKQLQQTKDKISATQAEIRETEQELQRKEQQMQKNATTLYKEGDPSTLEILFSSDSFTDFISRKQYLDSVKEELDQAAKESKQLKQELEQKKSNLEELRKKQSNKKHTLESRRNEQQRFLEETRGKESRYQEIITDQQDKLEKKREQQREALSSAINARSGNGPDYSGHSSYPFPDAAMNYNDSCIYPNGISGADPYGYCKRQCTSYVAWKLNKDGRSGYMFLGHAISWKDDGQYVDFRNAQRGDVLVWNVGGYGHVMYVENVSNDGLGISQFNVPYGSGKYSTDFYSWNELENGINGTSFYLRRF